MPLAAPKGEKPGSYDGGSSGIRTWPSARTLLPAAISSEQPGRRSSPEGRSSRRAGVRERWPSEAADDLPDQRLELRFAHGGREVVGLHTDQVAAGARFKKLGHAIQNVEVESHAAEAADRRPPHGATADR